MANTTITPPSRNLVLGTTTEIEIILPKWLAVALYDWTNQKAWSQGAWSPGAWAAGAWAPGAWHNKA